jgi:hypothetical protein
VVAQLVEALRYKLRVADSIPDITEMFYWQSHVPGVDSACNRNEYQ